MHDLSAAYPLMQDVQASEDVLEAGEDLGVLTHGMLAALAMSVPLWLCLAWLAIRLMATLPGL
ncbi:MAG: hypothetical protein AB7P40_27685 [Chloroflexota bacterium]